MYIGKKICFKRKTLGLTQEELCNGICSITYLSKVENDKLVPKEDILQLLCDRLGMTIEELKYNEFNEYMDKLQLLYKRVNNRDTNNIEEEINKLLSFHFNNPILLTAFHIIQLEFNVIKRDFDKSCIYRNHLMNEENYLNSEIYVWYYKSLGYFEYTFGDISQSLNYFNKAKELLDKEDVIDVNLEYVLGIVNSKLTLLSRSIFHVEKALEVYSRNLNFEKIIDCKLLLGINYSNMGHYKMGKRYYLSIIDALNKTDNKSMLGKVYNNLGNLYLNNNEYQNAINALKKAINFKKNAVEKLSAIYLLAYVYKKIDDLDGSLKLCEKGLNLSVSHLLYHYKLLILKHSIITDGFYKKDFIEKLDKIIIPYFSQKYPAIASECLNLLADIMSAEYKYKQASCYYKKALELNSNYKQRELLF